MPISRVSPVFTGFRAGKNGRGRVPSAKGGAGRGRPGGLPGYSGAMRDIPRIVVSAGDFPPGLAGPYTWRAGSSSSPRGRSAMTARVRFPAWKMSEATRWTPAEVTASISASSSSTG